jgi:NADH-quinone oxidoreductase subunit M
MFGKITNPQLATITDIDRRELLIFVPLIVGTLWLGFMPNVVLDLTQSSVDALVATYRAAIG